MNYPQAIAYLYGLASRGVQPGLTRFEAALALRGRPQHALPSVLVAGTNGKGSVATMIAAMLTASGHKVGLYTSPHMHRLVERFRIAGRPVAERTLARKVTALKPFLEHPETPPLTFFEVGTLLAFELFREAGCDVMVLEVGLGGRLDSTNVVTPLVSVIASVALDHTDRLGSTLAQIAREKAGIIKPGVPVVSGVSDASARRVVRQKARAARSPLYELGREVRVTAAEGTCEVEVAGQRCPRLRVPLAGAYQNQNLACAVAAIAALPKRFAADQTSVRKGLLRTRWPGRLELLPGSPSVLCDAAHNPHAAEALARHLSATRASHARRVLLYGAMRDKDHARMIAILRPQVDALVFTSVPLSRAESAHELARRYGGEAREQPEKALRLARKLAGTRGLVVACGSIFVMSAVRACVLGLRTDPPIAL